MRTVPSSEGACEKIRQYLDSYISNELLVETNHEVLRHLEQCTRCSQELETRIRVRTSLQNAVRGEVVPVDLQQKVRKRIHESRPGRTWAAGVTLRWMSAVAALVLFLVSGSMALQHRRTQDADIRTVSGRLSSILQVGLRDHIHAPCSASTRKILRHSPNWRMRWGRGMPDWSRW